MYFELNARPRLDAAGNITRAGDDLDARGLTEFFFDVVYWTWATVLAAALVGDRAWWMWAAIPLYSAYAAFRAFGGVRDSLGAMAGAGADPARDTAQSNRQKKMEKRGGQRVAYR